MASAHRDNHRNGFRAQVFIRGRLRKLWLGPVTATGVKLICNHLEALKVAAETASPPSADAMKWARSVDARIQKQLAKWGLIASASSELPRDLAGWLDYYVAEVAGATSTKTRWKNVASKLKSQFPAGTTLISVTAGDADRISRWLRSSFSESHAGKTLSDMRQAFEAAMRNNLITANPFAEVNTRAKHDKAREHYIDVSTIDTILDHADPYYAAIIALARFGGLRVPSEPLGLLWTHIDWAGGKMQIHSRKTGFRVVPLFPEIRKRLNVLWESDGDPTNVFHRARNSAGTVWRDKLLAICQAAGVKPWPKLWQNLRASCRTDLEQRFPGFVCDAWLGHSGKIAAKHYSRVHDGHFSLACGVVAQDCGVAGGVADPSAPDSTRHPQQDQTNKKAINAAN
jgi:integrase